MSANTVYRIPLFAMSLLSLSLTACDPNPAANQASRDAGRIIEQASSPAAGKMTEESKSAEMDGVKSNAAAIDDVELNIKVQSALNGTPALKFLPIIVETSAGVVTLSGTTDTSDKRAQAERVAMNVIGVKAVENKLVVKSM